MTAMPLWRDILRGMLQWWRRMIRPSHAKLARAYPAAAFMDAAEFLR